MIRSLTRRTAFSRHPRMLLALPTAAALAVTLAACGSSGNPSAHPATPEAGRCGAQAHPFRAGARRGHHAAGIAGHRARAATADHGTHAARESHPAGQRRRPGRRQQWRAERW